MSAGWFTTDFAENPEQDQISGSHGGEYEGDSLLGYSVL
jgi:hypothetical protein